MKTKKEDKAFDVGYACAVSNLINMYGISTEATELFNQSFDSYKSLKDLNLDEFDRKILKKHF